MAALVTLALVPNNEPHRYGGVLVDAQPAASPASSARSGCRRVVSLHRRAGRASGQRSTVSPAGDRQRVDRRRLRRADRSKAGVDSRVRLRRGVLGRRHGRRLLAARRARSVQPARPRIIVAARNVRIEPTARVTTLDSVGRCGGRRWTASSTNASSPTGCGCRPGATYRRTVILPRTRRAAAT